MDEDSCYRAVRSRDARFDGWFVTAVTTTGIYCRPSCPARTPGRSRVRFYAGPAAAQAAGFRACKRCRPDAVPGSPEWSVRADLTGRAMRLIADGVVDRDGVDGLADQLGYSTRQVHRHLVAQVGAGPLALARAQRAQTARTLLEGTDLSVSEVAFAAGFGSVRQFNDTVRTVFATSPSGLRAGSAGDAATAGALALRLAVRRPFAGDQLVGFLRDRAVPGLEAGVGPALCRSLVLPRGLGTILVTAYGDHVRAVLRLADVRDLPAAVARTRRWLDLDADPVAVDETLGQDPLLGRLVRAVPGRRVPGGVDGFEVAVRAVVGQRVAAATARAALSRLVARYGTPLGPLANGAVTHAFPAASALADAADLPLPAARARAVRALARAVAEGRVDLSPGADRAAVESALLGVPGIGPWTVAVLRLRGLQDPDVLPETDLALRRAAAAAGVTDLSTASRGWRPWRSYATAHLWAGPSRTGEAA